MKSYRVVTVPATEYNDIINIIKECKGHCIVNIHIKSINDIKIQDKNIDSLTEIVSNHTKDQYVFLLTCTQLHANINSKLIETKTNLAAVNLNASSLTKQKQIYSTDIKKKGQSTPPFYGLKDTGPEYINSVTILSMFVVFFVLIIFVFALNCTLAIQTPLRYATPDMLLPQSKEY